MARRPSAAPIRKTNVRSRIPSTGRSPIFGSKVLPRSGLRYDPRPTSYEQSNSITRNEIVGRWIDLPEVDVVASNGNRERLIELLRSHYGFTKIAQSERSTRRLL